MTERTAIVLLFVVLSVVTLGGFFALDALHVDQDVIVFAYLIVLSVGGLSAGWLVSYYADKRTSERDQR